MVPSFLSVNHFERIHIFFLQLHSMHNFLICIHNKIYYKNITVLQYKCQCFYVSTCKQSAEQMHYDITKIKYFVDYSTWIFLLKCIKLWAWNI